MKKRIIAVLMAGMMLFTAAPAEVLAAEPMGQGEETIPESLENREFPSGGVVVEAIPVSEEEIQGLLDASETTEGEIVGAERSQKYSHSWDKYSSNYIYNRLKSNEKKCWDELNAVANYYLSSPVNAQYVTVRGRGFYALEPVMGVKYGLGLARMQELYLMFLYSNPQFYFLDGSYLTSGSTILPCSYSSFARGTDRNAATEAVGRQISAWQSKISKGKNDIQKAQIAHDLILKKVSYDEGYLGPYSQTPYHQSAYSVFCDDYTVCAGYTKAFEILMNGAGIDTIGVTSTAHAWNKICINDSWYNVDLTWDDLDGKAGKEGYYMFFNRSDAMITGKLDQSPYHEMEGLYAGLVPKCTQDSGITQEDPFQTGTYHNPSIAVKTPVVKLNKSSRKYVTVTLSSEPGAVIYYTTDGINPSSSYSRSIRYTKPFAISSNVNLKAIAVRDKKKNSRIVSKKVYGKVNNVLFHSGKGSRVSSQKVYTNDKVKKPSNPKRSGYVFAGWYKDSRYRTAWNFNSKVTKNTSLYAKWAKKSTVKFNPNRGTVKTKVRTVGYKEAYGTLPSPVRKGYSFLGWYTKKSGGKKITEKSKVTTTKTTVLYAQWKKVGVVKTNITRLNNLSGNKMDVSVKKISGVMGYQIRYSMKSNMKSSQITTSKGNRKVIDRLTGGKRYYVQVRGYKVDSANRKIYGGWSTSKSVIIKK